MKPNGEVEKDHAFLTKAQHESGQLHAPVAVPRREEAGWVTLDRKIVPKSGTEVNLRLTQDKTLMCLMTLYQLRVEHGVE
jgi:hypothetical protein